MSKDQYGVFGNPVAHSKSPEIHHAFAAQTKESLQYSRFLGDLENFEEEVRAFFSQGGRGLNVTVPFKQRAFDLCQVLSKRAQQAEAVNTLFIGKNGELFGDNTDGVGMVRDICENHEQALAGKRVLLLGAGGAIRGIMEPLLNERPTEVVIANRTLSKAQALVSQFSPSFVTLKASEFADLEGSFDVIINGTSASLTGDLPPLANHVIGSNTWCYDMMYGKTPTVFLEWAKQQGAQGADGLGMLIEQAAESFYLWRMKRPFTQAVIAEMRAAL